MQPRSFCKIDHDQFFLGSDQGASPENTLGSYTPAELEARLAECRRSLQAERDHRARLEAELHARLMREQQVLDQIGRPPAASITAAAYGARTLRAAAPAVFEVLVTRYEAVLVMALDQRHYTIDYHLPEALRALAAEMGSLRLTPRDVVEIHNAALERERSSLSAQKEEALIEEGRLALLELMGYLAAYYRQFAFGV